MRLTVIVRARHAGPPEPQARQWKAEERPRSTDVLLDPQVGRAYEAKTTPHMYVVDGPATLVYMGGIDDKASSDPDSLKAPRTTSRPRSPM